jgi:poly-gamma-glutamate capsule biosynthesis protein CapA/YwtB (metallophosphatase superfamily)
MYRKLLTTLCIAFSINCFSQQCITIGLVGDIMMGKSYPTSKHKEALAPSAATYLSAVSPYLKKNDLNIGNLESVLLDKGGRMLKSISVNHYSFKTPTRYARDLRSAGFNILTIANNHTMDFGFIGRHSTINALNEAGIAFTGFHDKYKYVSIKKKGLKIAVCAFSFGPAFNSVNDIPKAQKIIKRLKQEHNVVIVSMHAGNEGNAFKHIPFRYELTGKSKRGDVYHFSHACIDAGASLVFGHGPHVPRAIELYKNHLIAYSLGNFCTPYEINLTNAGAYAPLLSVQLDNNGSFKSGIITPFIQTHGKGPVLDKKKYAITEITNLTKYDFPKGSTRISSNGIITLS